MGAGHRSFFIPNVGKNVAAVVSASNVGAHGKCGGYSP